MKHLVLLTILTAFSIVLDAKSIASIKKTLQNRDFMAFCDAIDSFNSKDPMTGLGDWWRRQELTPGFEAAIIYIAESFPVKKDPASWVGCEYRIHLIATKSEIIYYAFRENLYTSVLDSNEYFITSSFRNQHLVDSMRSEYYKLYHAYPDERDIFEDNREVYGSYCGEGGSPPPCRVILDSILAKNDYDFLDRWLRSTNVIHQIYAIDGLYKAKKDGYKLTPDQIRIIEVIGRKKGKALTCRGCFYDKEPIGEIVQAIIAEYPK
jgi:hypothetical protein